MCSRSHRIKCEEILCATTYWPHDIVALIVDYARLSVREQLEALVKANGGRIVLSAKTIRAHAIVASGYSIDGIPQMGLFFSMFRGYESRFGRTDEIVFMLRCIPTLCNDPSNVDGIIATCEIRENLRDRLAAIENS